MQHYSADHRHGIQRPGGPLTLCLVTVLTAVAFAQPSRSQVPGTFVSAPPTTGKVRLVDDPKAKNDDKPERVEPKKDVRPEGKKIAFSMDSKPWKGVFEWVSAQTGKPVINTTKPTGTFSFTSPAGATFELGEVIDIINEALLAQKFYLLDSEKNWIVIPADEKIDASKLPTVTLDELDSRGRNELVRIEVTLKTLQAEDIAPAIKKMMGPFGDITVLEKFNKLYLQDTGGNLRRVRKLIREYEENATTGANTSSYKCEYIKAMDAERILKDQLGDSNKIIAPSSSGGGGRDSRPSTPTVDTKKLLFITSDERTNTLLFTGPVDKMAEAEALARRIDQKRAGGDKILLGEPTIKTYSVPAGTAESWDKLLKETIKSPVLRISVVPGNQLLIHAYPQDHFDIAKTLAGNKEAKTEVKNATIDCGDRDAADMVKTVSSFLGDTKAGGPLVEAIADRNAILVRGSDDQIKMVKELVEAVNGKGTTGTGRTRTIELEGGSAPVLAEELARLMSRMRKNPVEVTSPDRLRDEDAKRREEQRRREREEKEKLKDKETRLRMPKEFPVSVADEGGLVDPRDTKKEPKKTTDLPGSADKPLRIFASGNKLILASDDPEMLALANQVINLYRKSPGKGDFTVVKLRNVTAVDAAKALEEAFNGKSQQGGGRGNRGGPGGMLGGMMGGMLGGMLGGGAPGGSGEEDRIRVVAYPATNSLLVRATPLDMLLVRRLLADALDPEFDEEDELIRTYILPLKNATASDVAALVKEVFPPQGRGVPGARGNTGGGDPRAAMMQAMMTGQPPQQPQAPVQQLSIGVDDRNNRLIVACPERMYAGIKKLVENIDEASKDTARTIKVVNVQGLDPALVQQVIDAVQGRRPTRGGSGFGSGFPGSMGTGGMMTPGGGGMMPGGMMPGGMIPGMGTGGGFDRGGRGTGFPGSTGGGFDRGTGGGGRGTRGGGGGGTRGGPQASLAPSPGSADFFAQRVTDDPQLTATGLYDPQLDNRTSDDKPSDPGVPGHTAGASARNLKITPIHYQDEKKPDDKKPDDKTPGTPSIDSVRAPQAAVDVVPIESLGVLVIRGNTPTDVQAVLEIIEILKKNAAENDVKIQIVPLQNADATTATAYLDEIFRRILFTPTGTRINTNPDARPGNLGSGLGTVTPNIGGTGGVGTGGTITGATGSGIVLIPLPRVNSILVGAPQILMPKVLAQISEFDKTPPSGMAPRVIQLKRASAARVAQLITNWAAGRFPREPGANQTQIRVTYDDQLNKLFVQAAPADFTEIAKFVEELDNGKAAATNDLRIFEVRYGLADDISNLIRLAIQQGYRPTNATTTQGITTTPGGAGQPGGQIGGQPGGGLGGAAGGAAGSGLINPSTGLIGATAPNTKTVALRLINAAKGTSIESSNLDSVLLLPDVRTNRIIVSAPEETMDLINSLIKSLDVPPAYKAEVNIFQLKKADATQMALTLQQLFLGQAQGAGGGVTQGGLNIGAGANTAGLLGQIRPLAITFGDLQPEGLPLIDLRISTDIRTNSIIVAGSRADLEIAEALISRLEDSKVEIRRNEVYRLMNSTAVDVANALNNFILQSIQVYRNAQQLTPFQDIEREVVVVPEPITNKLLISATPRYFPDIMRLVAELDAELPQVVIQVLIAEVSLNNTEEFGVEVGLQSPLLFQRSITGLTTGTTNGTPINFGFNNPPAGLGNNPFVAPGTVGVQGLGSLGVGRVSPNSGVGGFVFSLSNDAFSLLIRALRTQGRADILSRPQVMAVDNQAATVAVGQSVPFLGGTVLGVGQSQQNVIYRDVGVILNVVPKIFPDGKVTMRVTPQVSSVAPGTVNLGNGVNSPIFNQQIVDTTVTARDGETVVIGGLITRNVSKTENKIPWLGDLPYLGAAFRYRQEVKTKQELVVILTPRVVRNQFERQRILAEEGRRVDWILGDVVKTQGATGMDPLFRPAMPGGPSPSVTDGAMPTLPLPTPVPAPSGPLAPVLPPPGTLLPSSGGVAPIPAPAPPGAQLPSGPAAPARIPAPGSTPVPPASLGALSGSLPGAQASGGVTTASFPSNDRPLAGLTIPRDMVSGGTTPTMVASVPPLSTVPTVPAANPAVPAAAATMSTPAPSAGTATPTANPVPATKGKESDRWRLFPRWR